MTLLSILYWIILILSVVFGFITTSYGPMAHNFAQIALFILIGLKIFKTPIE